MFILSVAVTLEYYKEKSCWEFKICFLNRKKTKKNFKNPQKCKTDVKYLQANRQNANLPNRKEHWPPGTSSWEELLVIALMKSLQFPSVCMNANRSRGCRNNHPSPSDAIACQGEDDIATACPGKAGIVWEQEFPAGASQGSIEELHLPFTAQDKVPLVKHNWNGRKFQSKHEKEELCCAGRLGCIEWKRQGE